MLVKLILGTTPRIEEATPIGFSAIQLAGTAAREEHLEDLIVANVNLLSQGDEDNAEDTLLIIGRQVVTSTGKRMDLVALDGTGAILLVEVKRDARDMASRRDHAEMQSVRYAASLARLRSVDEIVSHLYGPYVERFEHVELAKQAGSRSASEWARKKLLDFMDYNGLDPSRLNHSQRVVLVGASFDEDTASAAAWMAANGLPIRVIELRPWCMGNEHFLEVVRIIPVPKYEDFYVDLTPPRSSRRGGVTAPAAGTPLVMAGAQFDAPARANKLKVADLYAAGRLKAGEEVRFKNDANRIARLSSTPGRCSEGGGREMSLLEWSKDVSGWAAVNVYDWLVHLPTGQTLAQIRREVEELPARDTVPVEPV